jgi:DNA-binding response OmpR family regulator
MDAGRVVVRMEAIVSGQHALLVDSSVESAQVCGRMLEQEGYVVTATAAGAEGIEIARSTRPELTILDADLEDMDGFEVCRQIRAVHHGYVIMVSARESEADKILGFTLGADDYVVRPYSPRELAVRIRAMRRRPLVLQSGAASSQDRLRIDAHSREVIVEGAPVELTKLEFDLLDTLASSPRRTFTRTQLLHSVWGNDWYGDDHVIDVHVGNLRRKLGESASAPRHVRTVRGVGYRFEAA